MIRRKDRKAMERKGKAKEIKNYKRRRNRIKRRSVGSTTQLKDVDKGRVVDLFTMMSQKRGSRKRIRIEMTEIGKGIKAEIEVGITGKEVGIDLGKKLIISILLTLLKRKNLIK